MDCLAVVDDLTTAWTCKRARNIKTSFFAVDLAPGTCKAVGQVRQPKKRATHLKGMRLNRCGGQVGSVAKRDSNLTSPANWPTARARTLKDGTHTKSMGFAVSPAVSRRLFCDKSGVSWVICRRRTKNLRLEAFCDPATSPMKWIPVNCPT
jgi:hypothetical protein